MDIQPADDTVDESEEFELQYLREIQRIVNEAISDLPSLLVSVPNAVGARRLLAVSGKTLHVLFANETQAKFFCFFFHNIIPVVVIVFFF